MMSPDLPIPSRRRQDILSRVRQRQAARRQLSTDQVLEEEQRIFAEDEQYVPQLLQAYALLEGKSTPEELARTLQAADPLPLFLSPESVAPPKPALPALTPSPSAPRAQRDRILEPPPADKEPTEFDRQHNALRLYVIQQFEEGKKSREIAELINMTPHKLSRWYNQVKDLPPAMHLWIPLLKEGEVDVEEAKEEAAEEVPVPTPKSAPTRLREPSREAVKAAKKALRNAAKNAQIEQDRERVLQWISANTAQTDDPVVASRLAALAFHREGWSLSQIGRALDLDVSTISRWMTRARQAEQAEEALQKGMDKRRAEQKLREAQANKTSKVSKPPVQRTPKPKVTLLRHVVPLSPMARRSAGALQARLELAETDGQGTVWLWAGSAMERERITASLSMLEIEFDRPVAKQGGFAIPLPLDEAHYLRRMLAQS